MAIVRAFFGQLVQRGLDRFVVVFQFLQVILKLDDTILELVSGGCQDVDPVSGRFDFLDKVPLAGQLIDLQSSRNSIWSCLDLMFSGTGNPL
jgi:hypothetical protein